MSQVRVKTALLALTVTGVFAGCSVSPRFLPPPEAIPARTVADQAENGVLSASQTSVDIDCGDGIVPFAVGTQVPCVGTEAGTVENIPLLIEITAIEGQNFTVSVESNWPAGP